MEDRMCWLWECCNFWLPGSVECVPVPAASAASALHLPPAHEPLHGRGVLQQEQSVASAHPGAWQGGLHLIDEKYDVWAHTGWWRAVVSPGSGCLRLTSLA